MEDTPGFIGRGWNFPPAFGKQGHVVRMVHGPAEVEQGIEILLRTQLGERQMHQEFGGSLEAYAFEEISATLLNEIKGNIEMALVNYERRIEVLKVNVSAPEPEKGMLLIEVDYLIPETNSRYNRVFPYYLEEAAETDFNG